MYDSNKDGTLDKKETKRLISESIAEIKRFVPKQIEIKLEAELKAGLEQLQANSRGASAKEFAATKRELEEDVTNTKRDMLSGFSNWLEGTVKASDQIVDDLWLRMDANGDGRVVKQEFLDNFHRAYAEAFKAPSSMITG